MNIARYFATNLEVANGEFGVILELDEQYTIEADRSNTRCHGTPWISPFPEEDESLLFGYNNTILIKDMWIRTYSGTQNALAWKSLQFEMNALNYWCQISMGYAGIKDYNIPFDGTKYKKSNTQKFLARLNISLQ